MITRFLYKPLIILWKLTVFVLLLDYILYLVNGYSYIDRMNNSPHHLDRLPIWIGLMILGLVWRFEKKSGHNLTRILLGSRLRMIIKEDRIRIGGWYPRIRMKRDVNLTFASQPIEGAKSDVYQESQQLMLVVDDSRAVKVASIFPTQRARLMVENANMALRLGIENDPADLDYDPSRAGAV